MSKKAYTENSYSIFCPRCDCLIGTYKIKGFETPNESLTVRCRNHHCDGCTLTLNINQMINSKVAA